jgi:hypothetical protein
LATARVPAIVSVPIVVTGPPEKVKPVEPPEALTLVTEPPEPVAEIVIEPAPLVTATPEPAVMVALVSVLPVVLPIRICPSVKVVWPVPPRLTGRVPVTPVLSGRPVALVSVAKLGTPMLGVVSTGEVERTLLPEPVDDVTPVPPLATGRVPDTPVVSGRPVALVSVANDGTPMLGVVSTGEVDRTLLPEPVDAVTPVPPLATARVPPSVSVPEPVMGPPVRVRPVEPPEPLTLVTVPPEPVAEIVMDPVLFVTVTPVPAVSVALVSVLPVVLPISSWPLV